MKYGYFDDKNKEYVITTPFTPLPWINYLGNKDFFSLISNTAGGYSFYKDAKLRRIMRYRYNSVPRDNSGRHIYILDNDTHFSPSYLPLKTPLDIYECHVGLGYTKFVSQKNDLKSELTVFIPLNDNVEISYLKITNNSSKTKKIKVFSQIEFCLWNAVDDSTNFQRNYSTGEVEIEKNTIYHKSEYRERRNHYAFYSVNKKPCGYDSDLDSFLGKFNDYDKPQVVINGKSNNSVASGWSPCASFENQIEIKPGKSKTLIYILGYVENDEENKWKGNGIINKDNAYFLINKYHKDSEIKKALKELKNYWTKLLDKFHVNTTDKKFDRMINIWNQYQCMVTFNMSRSASYYESGIGRGMGFRDSCQDLLGFVHLIPKKARERILDIASIQFEDGSTWHQYQPLDKKGNADIGGGFNDDPLWLIACTHAYLCETNDYSILSEMVTYNSDKNNKATLLDHLKASFNYTKTHKGPHGLPLIGRADWNDCLNLNCFSKTPGESFQTCSNFESHKAESVFIAAMFVKYGKDLADILHHLKKEDEAKDILKEVNKMKDAVEKFGWDGEWFLRAYDAFLNPVGSHLCDDGKIYIEPQGMCVMAGIGIESKKAEKALDSVKKHLDTKYGIVLLQPAYKEYHLNLGEVSSYPRGYKENAGIFCHNNPWISIAEAILHHEERAFEVYKKICPSYLETISEIHKIEPYVFSQMIAGKDAKNFGEAKNSWLTGTSAWTFVNSTQYLLGIRPTLNGLYINPRLPKKIKHFKVKREFQGKIYIIEGKRTSLKPHIEINHKVLEDNIIPLDTKSGTTIKVYF